MASALGLKFLSVKGTEVKNIHLSETKSDCNHTHLVLYNSKKVHQQMWV